MMSFELPWSWYWQTFHAQYIRPFFQCDNKTVSYATPKESK